MTAPSIPKKAKRVYVPLTQEQRIRKQAAELLNNRRQLLYPPEFRPRRSPRLSAPRPDRSILQSMRTAAEHPSEHPNDFRYLFRDLTKDYTAYLWLNSQGVPQSPEFSNLLDACAFLTGKGWLDASW